MYLFYSLDATANSSHNPGLAVRCTREWLQQGYITRDSIATLENHGEEQADADADAEHTQLAIITGIEDSASPNDRRCTRPN